jgi:hypothetical protein
VFLAVSGYLTRAVNLAGERPVFPDDFQKAGDLWYGYVNFKPGDHFLLEKDREYYFTLALGTSVSNTLHIPRGSK